MLEAASRRPGARIAASVSFGLLSTAGVWLWKSFVDCSGRLDRNGLLRALVLALLILVGLSVALFLAFELRTTILHGPKSWFYRIELPLWLAMAGLFLRPVARRFHDLNRSGLHAVWLLTALILGIATKANIETVTAHVTSGNTISYPSDLHDWPLFIVATIPQVAAIALMLWPGTKGPNRYGPPAA